MGPNSNRMKWAECTYCGDSATCFDHVPPVSALYDDPVLRKKYRERTSKVGDPAVVPVCFRCNVTLSSRRLFTVHERAAFISDRYSARYEKLYSSALWTESEIEQLGTVLRTSVKSYQNKRLLLLEQIRYANVIKVCDWLDSSHVWAAYNTGLTLNDYVHKKIYGFTPQRNEHQADSA